MEAETVMTISLAGATGTGLLGGTKLLSDIGTYMKDSLMNASPSMDYARELGFDGTILAMSILFGSMAYATYKYMISKEQTDEIVSNLEKILKKWK